jgi:hypothetical protein
MSGGDILEMQICRGRLVVLEVVAASQPPHVVIGQAYMPKFSGLDFFSRTLFLYGGLGEL